LVNLVYDHAESRRQEREGPLGTIICAPPDCKPGPGDLSSVLPGPMVDDGNSRYAHADAPPPRRDPRLDVSRGGGAGRRVDARGEPARDTAREGTACPPCLAGPIGSARRRLGDRP